MKKELKNAHNNIIDYIKFGVCMIIGSLVLVVCILFLNWVQAFLDKLFGEILSTIFHICISLIVYCLLFAPFIVWLVKAIIKVFDKFKVK